MVVNLEWERILEKMVTAALKEKFSFWNRKYGQMTVTKVWAKKMGDEGSKNHTRRLGWTLDMTLREALEKLDDYGNEIEDRIREQEGEK